MLLSIYLHDRWEERVGLIPCLSSFISATDRPQVNPQPNEKKLPRPTTEFLCQRYLQLCFPPPSEVEFRFQRPLVVVNGNSFLECKWALVQICNKRTFRICTCLRNKAGQNQGAPKRSFLVTQPEKMDCPQIGPKAQKCKFGTKLGGTNPDLMAFEVKKEKNMFGMGRFFSPRMAWLA